jgi:hypothetical protein
MIKANNGAYFEEAKNIENTRKAREYLLLCYGKRVYRTMDSFLGMRQF